MKQEEIKNTVFNIISTYEMRIRHIESIFDITYELFEHFQNSLLYTKNEQENVKIEIRELFAQKASVRKKDFDHIMQEVFLAQEKKEVEVKKLLSDNFKEQKTIALLFSENLKKLIDFLIKGETEKIKIVYEEISKVLAQQVKKKNVLIFKVQKIKEERQELIERLKNFSKAKNLRIKDLKLTFQEKPGQEERSRDANL